VDIGLHYDFSNGVRGDENYGDDRDDFKASDPIELSGINC
jgi:hypothetical protein